MTRPHEQTHPWERAKGESRKAFEAFALYRDIGPGRSYVKVGQGLGRSTTLIDRWGSRWDWQARVDSYERHMDQRQRTAAEEARQEMIQRHVTIGRSMISLGSQGLLNLQKVLKRSKGVKINLTAADISRLLESGVKIERLSNGETTEQFEATIKPDLSGIRDDPDTVRLVHRILAGKGGGPSRDARRVRRPRKQR